MQVGEDRVLTIEAAPLILKILNTLSTGVESESGEALGTLKRLEDFTNEGCGRLILNLRAIDEPLDGMPKGVRNVRASLVGGVLFVTCQISTSELLRIKVLTRRHSFQEHLISGFDALFSSAAARFRTAISRIGNPKAN